MLDKIKTIGLVTVIAALIWVWAEAESLKVAPATVRLSLVSASTEGGDEDLVVRLVGDADAGGGGVRDELRVRLEGTTAAIDEAERILSRPVKVSPGVGGVPGTPGDHAVSMAEVLRRSSELARTGVTVAAVEPSVLTMRVVRLVSVRLPVRADLTGIDAEAPDAIVPGEIRARVPEGDAAKLAADAFATAAITPEDRAALRDDSPQTIKARVRLPAPLDKSEVAGRIEPETVQVTLRIRKRVETMELPPVPVWISLPPTEGKDWNVEVKEPLLRGVTASGPAEQIARLRSRDLVAIAFVVLSTDELQAGIESKTAVFAPVPVSLIGAASGGATPGSNQGTARPGAGDGALMEQVAPLKFTVENRKVGLKITKRGANGAPGTSGPNAADRGGGGLDSPLPGP